MSTSDKIIWAIVCVMLFLLGAAVGTVTSVQFAQKEAVQAGVGRYNPATGVFEWVRSEKNYYGITPLTPEQKVQNEILLNRLNNWKCE